MNTLHQEHHNVANSGSAAADSTTPISLADDQARDESRSRWPLAPLQNKKSPARGSGSSRTRVGTMCLSIRQPWAWLIANGWKNVENRTWPTQFRGRFLIHASAGMTRSEYDAARIFVAGFAPSLVIPPMADLERGGIVGEAVLLDCVQRHDSEWFCGPYGFVVDEARPLPFHPMRGRLGFFRAEDLPSG